MGEADSPIGGMATGDEARTGISPSWVVPTMPAWLDDQDGRDRFDPRHARGREDADDDDEPVGRRTPPTAVALIVIGLIACAVAGYTILTGDDDGAMTPVAFPTTAGATSAVAGSAAAPVSAMPSNASTPAPAAKSVVSVVGLVRRPGLVRLSPQARIADAIDAAGGAKPGADMLGLNLAQPVHDGDQILVGYSDPTAGTLHSAVVSGGQGAGGQPPAGGVVPTSGSPTSGPAGTSSAATGAGKVNVNTATAEQLDTLPGVGPVTAAAIIAWRDAHGRFGSVDQLGEVDGIGPSRLAKLRELVSV